MISNPTTIPPGPVPESAQDHALKQFNGIAAKLPQTLPATNEASSSVPQRTGWGWLILCGMAAAMWYYQVFWLPWVTFLLPAGTAPPLKRVVRPTPVVTATVRQCDMPIYLNGLGTVTAFKTVTIRSRAEGELVKVAFTEGQMVRAGDLLAEIDPRPFEVQRDQAEGQLARDEATLKLAKLMLARSQDLIKSKSVAQQQVDEQVALVQQTEGSMQANRATLANARLQLSYCRIVAPISGQIGLRLVDQGNIVRANDSIGMAVITQFQPIAVVFTIPQDDIARVQKQKRDDHALTVEAYDRDFKTKLASGTLVAIDNQVDPTTGTVRLKAMFENEDNLLFPNQFVNVRLLVDTKRDAIVVPSAAVQRGPTSTFVWVVKADETVEPKNVVIGPTEGSETSIESGLGAGEIVVTEGVDKLQRPTDDMPGTKVSIRDKEKGKIAGGTDSPSKAGEKGAR